jgi:hypothetical protein
MNLAPVPASEPPSGDLSVAPAFAAVVGIIIAGIVLALRRALG